MTLQLSDAVAALHDIIEERRSIRSFRDEPIPRGEVETLLRAALWAPSPHNSQPWRFTVLFVVSDKRRLADGMADRLEEELRASGTSPEDVRRVSDRSRQRISSAPVVLLCSLVDDGLVLSGDRAHDDLERQMAVQSVGAVLQTLALAAHARAIGTCWMAAPMYCPDVVRDVLSLPPEFSPQALVLMGYADGPGRRRERRSFEDVVDLR